MSRDLSYFGAPEKASGSLAEPESGSTRLGFRRHVPVHCIVKKLCYSMQLVTQLHPYMHLFYCLSAHFLLNTSVLLAAKSNRSNKLACGLLSSQTHLLNLLSITTI